MKPSFAKLLRRRRASDSDVIRRSPASVARDGASSGLSHSIRRLIPSFGRKSSNAGIVTPYTYVSPAGFNATISHPKQVVMVGTEMARMDSVLSVPEFTDPRPAPTAPPGPRFTDSTIRSTVSDPEVLGVRDIFSLEYLKQLQRTTKRRYNIRRVAWRRRPSNVAGVEGLREDLSVKNSDITCIEFIDDDLVDCGELVLISKVNTSQDFNSPMGALTVQKASKGLDAKGKLKQSDNMLTKVEQTPGPSVSSEMPVKAPVAPRAAAKAATPNEPTPGACTCTICERAKKQANIDEMSEEEQVELALSRSMDEYFMPSYESAALRRQAVMVN